jgi:hypothetical protein
MKEYSWLVVFILISSYGCWNGDSISSQSSEYKTGKKNITKIIVLPPAFIAVKKKSSSNIMDDNSGYDVTLESVKQGMKDIKMDYILLDNTDSTKELFSYIIPLREELLKSSSLHDNPFDNFRGKTFTRKLFARSPRIDPKYCQLSIKYGTPYAMFIGVFTNESFHYQYLIIADLIKGEIVFRNLKYIRTKATKSIIGPTLYDSVYSIKYD